MTSNQGKKFELKFKEDWLKTIKNATSKDAFLLRLYDSTNGFVNISTPCDFIGFANGKLFLIECKSHNGASIPLTAIPQYSRLLAYKDFENIFPGIIVWFKDKDCVIWFPVATIEKEIAKGKKSINYQIADDVESGAIKLPGIKKRVFIDTDYSPLLDL